MDVTTLRILLIQIRKDPFALPAEKAGFVSLSGLSDHNFVVLDVFREPDFTSAILDDFDAFMIGGLSDDPSDSLEIPEYFNPWIDNLFALMKYAIKIKKPGLLSCGGFMLASIMLGAEVLIDPDQQELGIYDIFLTDEAQKDPLFAQFPSSFKAVSGHIKTTNTVPERCSLLAYSRRCGVHGIKVIGAPFYAFQFHPEVRCADLQARIKLYKEKYFDKEEAYQQFIDLMDDTSDANRMISKFVELVIKQSKRK